MTVQDIAVMIHPTNIPDTCSGPGTQQQITLDLCPEATQATKEPGARMDKFNDRGKSSVGVNPEDCPEMLIPESFLKG